MRLIPSTAVRVFRRIRGSKSAPAILLYHRVAEVQYDPWELAVGAQQFREQLAYLQRHRLVMPLDSFVEGLKSKTLPRNAIAITFDDGYGDNLANAKPLLTEFDMPATFFLATGWIGSSVPFWWDELAEWTLKSTQAVDHTEIIGGDDFVLRWMEPEANDLAGRWRASTEARSARQKAYMAIWRKLRDTSRAERRRAMASLRTRFGGSNDPGSLPMDRVEVQELIRGGLVTVGAHTVDHPALTGLSPEECHAEISVSAEDCRLLTGTAAVAFAYPYGDMNERVRKIVAEIGFTAACSTRASHSVGADDRYALPRLAVPNSLSSFVAMLNR